jgi:hypothetical protein
MKLALAPRTFAARTFRSATLAGSMARGPYRVAGAQAACPGAAAGQPSHSGATAGQSHA